MSSYGTGNVTTGLDGAGTGTGTVIGAGAGRRSISVQGRKSGEIIEEEDEDGIEEEEEDDDDDVEIVETFSPLTGNDEIVELFDEDVDKREVAK